MVAQEESKIMSELVECPVCSFISLPRRGGYDICPVCNWEDEGFISEPSVPTYGPNSDLSLSEARRDFIEKIGKTRTYNSNYARIEDLSEDEATERFETSLKFYKQFIEHIQDSSVAQKWTLQALRDLLSKLILRIGDKISSERRENIDALDKIFRELASDDNNFFVDQDRPNSEWWFHLSEQK